MTSGVDSIRNTDLSESTILYNETGRYVQWSGWNHPLPEDERAPIQFNIDIIGSGMPYSGGKHCLQYVNRML